MPLPLTSSTRSPEDVEDSDLFIPLAPGDDDIDNDDDTEEKRQ